MNELRPEIIQYFHDKPFATPVIGVTGGKGGVGKTTVAVNLAAALVNLGHRVALVDCDVDAPNGTILMGLPLEKPEEVSLIQPVFDPEKCNDCKLCIASCRHNSLFRPSEKNILLVGECNGCEVCFLVCPTGAFTRGSRPVGTTYKTVAGKLTVFTGALQPGVEETALVVNAVKERAFQEGKKYDIIIVDTAPGIHCNVINSLKGADGIIAVTEPTPLGAHDLELILSLLDMFELNRTVFINRADLPGNVDEIMKVADRHDTQIQTGLRLDNYLLESCFSGIPVVNMHPESLAAMTFTSIAGDIAREYL